MKIPDKLLAPGFAALFTASCSLGGGGPGHLHRAEEFTEQGNIDSAIEEYDRHIAYRLSVRDRPEWENPYFYLLLVGDLKLKKDDLDGALRSYEEAEKHSVDRSLVSDRFRQAGNYLAEHGEPREAIEILKKYRDRDPLLIDAMCDRLARQIISTEDASKEASKANKRSGVFKDAD